MEGVLSSANEWLEKAAKHGEGLMTQEAASKLIQEEPVSLTPANLKDTDLLQIAKEAGMSPQDVEEVITGKAPTSISSKALADSVLFDLSDEDREALEKINKL